MPFGPAYSRTKTFAAGGTLLPGDLNSIQDDLGQALEQRAPVLPVTALPVTPTDGQEVVFQTAAMALLSLAWRFKYRAASASPYKWEFIGGAEWRVGIATSQTVATGGIWTNLATVGPSITVPLAGDYDVRIESRAEIHNRNNGSQIGVSIAGADPNNPVAIYSSEDLGGGWASGQSVNHVRSQRIGALAASTVLKIMYYYTTAANGAFSMREIAVLPMRVG